MYHQDMAANGSIFYRYPNNQVRWGKTPLSSVSGGGGVLGSSWPNYANGYLNLGLEEEHSVRVGPASSVGGAKGIQVVSPQQNLQVDQVKQPFNDEDSSDSNSSDGKIHIVPKRMDSTDALYASLLSLIAVGFPATVMAVLAVLMTSQLQYYWEMSEGKRLRDIKSPERTFLFEIAMALFNFTLSFSLCTVLTAFLQLFLSLKSFKAFPQANLRVLKYLHQGVYLRLISFGGFFLSIPLFLTGLIAMAHLTPSPFGSLVSAYVITVVGGVGVLVCVLTLLHGLYSWCRFGSHLHKHTLESPNTLNKTLSNNKLSTLV